MSRKIETLTAEQEARFGEFVERWTAIGLSTEPADREKAERGIRDAYHMGGRNPPEQIVWCGSPLGQALTRAMILKFGNDDRGVGASVWDSVGASVRDSVGDSVGDSVWDSVGDSVYGQHEASWLGFYAFFREICDLKKETEKLVGLNSIAESAGWWLPHERICWVSERHSVCSLDERGMIHAETGPAIAYPDGWSIWAWHGVRVPQQVIETPQTLVPDQILGERNVEIRRVMIERFGQDRLLRETNVEVVGVDDYGELLRLPIANDEPIVMVKLKCPSTGHEYFERVPPDMERPRQALAWRAQVSESEYILAAES